MRFSSVNYSKPKTRLRKSSFRMSMRVPAIWKNVVANAEKEIEHIAIFKEKVKTKLLDFENEVSFFFK